MLSQPSLKRNLLKSVTALRSYHWGNYDASSSECCKIRDTKTTDCAGGKHMCRRMTPLSNLCHSQSDNEFLSAEYPKHLTEIYGRMRGQVKCDLIRIDKCLYQPSDKGRRYQRTWAECPLIWLRPKQRCCYDREYYPPIKRRERPPPGPPMTSIEKHQYNMKMCCATTITCPGCKTGRKPPICGNNRKPSDCKKPLAPYPSFSESIRQHVADVCPTECTCRIVPNMCDVWATYHRWHGNPKMCTKAIVPHCPFKKLVRYPYDKAVDELKKLFIQRRRFASRVPNFPDPPCQEIDKKCHYISRDACEHARNVLTRVLPGDKYLDQMQRDGQGKCCVYRPTQSHPCPEKQKRREKEKPTQPPFRSMWEPPCKPNEQPYCKKKLPRFDEIYYRPFEQSRCYQRTWIECPRVKFRMKKVCCLDGIEPPEILYRYKESCPKVACEQDFERMRRICQYIENPGRRCNRIYLPCCKMARCDPHCESHTHPSRCQKLRAPYPSYSEARKPRRRPKKYRDCQCLWPISQCELLAYARRRKTLGL